MREIRAIFELCCSFGSGSAETVLVVVFRFPWLKAILILLRSPWRMTEITRAGTPVAYGGSRGLQKSYIAILEDIPSQD